MSESGYYCRASARADNQMGRRRADIGYTRFARVFSRIREKFHELFLPGDRYFEDEFVCNEEAYWGKIREEPLDCNKETFSNGALKV